MAPRDRAEPRAARRARTAQAERRARMHLAAHLGWLEGLGEATAGGLRWWRLDGSPPFVVDGALLARARRAQRTLLAEHPDTIARLHGDVARWRAATDAALTAVAAATRSGGAPSAPLALFPPAVRRALPALAAAHPPLAPALTAAALAYLTRPERLGQLVRWVEPRAAALGHLLAAVTGPRGVLALLHLAALADEHGAARVEPLVELLASDAPSPVVALRAARTAADELRAGQRSPVIAPPAVAMELAAWLPRLVAAPVASQRRALELLGLLELPAPLARFRTWWRAAATRLTRVRDAIEATGTTELGHARAQLEALAATIKEAPLAFDLAAALAAVERSAWSGAAASFAPLCRLLARVPTELGGLARLRLLDELVDDAEVWGEAAHAWLWDALADELDRGAPAERVLAPWLPLMQGQGHGFHQPIRAAIRTRADARRAAALLVACGRRLTLSYVIVDRAMMFVPLDLDPARVAEALALVAANSGYFDTDQARAAVALADDRADDLAAMLAAVSELCAELPARAARELAALAARAGAAGGVWALRRLLAGKRGRAVTDAAAIAAVVPRRQWPPFVVDARAAWLDGYPAALRGALGRLASADPDAMVTARRLLRRDLPHPDDAARELAALRAGKARGPSAAGRVRRLERGSRPPGPQRLARLADAIERVAAQIALDRFAAATTAAATAAIAAAAGLPAWPGWPLDRPRVAVLAALAKLPPRSRELAMALVHRRAGPPPWDLRDEPRNRRFLDGLRRRGVDPRPWLDPTPVAVTAADGSGLTVGLAADPLDVLVMGEHFSTCLAAGGVNFFSVVTNAADINKRVLYARRGDGAVAGRCLFALTDGGRILTFEPYAHDPGLDFPGLVRAHALALAAAMGTEVVGSGPVSTLVADDWYDDGAHDLVGRFEALAEGSALRASLATIAPAELAARLEAGLGHALDDVTLPPVIGLPELQARPALVVALGPALGRVAAVLPVATIVQAARSALAAGDLALADRLLAGRARPSLFADAPRWIGEPLARVRPSQTLALLRATRGPGVRGWDGEPPERLVVAATALETLRRHRQAAALYRAAIARGWDTLRAELRPRLAALEAGARPSASPRPAR